MKRKIIKNRLGEILTWIKSQKLQVVCSVLMGIMVGSSFYNWMDTDPMTVSDYSPLEEQMTAIENSPATLKEIENYNIEKRGEVYTITLFNKECAIVKKFDKNFKSVSKIKKVDKSIPMVIAIFYSVVIGGIGYGITNFILGISVENKRKKHEYLIK